jgi:hypothetical protein
VTNAILVFDTFAALSASMDSPTVQQQSASAHSPKASSRASSKASLTLDLSDLPPLTQPAVPTNTLLLTNLMDKDIFRPDNLQSIRDLVAQIAPIHAWAPLKSFRRIVVSFFDEASAIRVRQVWDGEAILGERCRVYFGSPTPVDTQDVHLALPDAGKLFFISPPPSPPAGWEMKLEEAPNKLVHAEDLADALAKLRHSAAARGDQSPVSPVERSSPDGSGGFAIGTRQRSRSSTLIYEPARHGSNPDLPAIAVVDTTEEPDEMDISPVEATKPILAHTARPPVELMHEA